MQKYVFVCFTVPPVLSDASEEENVLSVLGSSNQFDCSAFGHPSPDIVWYKDGSVLAADDNDFATVNGSVLVLTGIDLRHNGTYNCEVSNVAGKVSKAFQLNVFSESFLSFFCSSFFIFHVHIYMCKYCVL